MKFTNAPAICALTVCSAADESTIFLTADAGTSGTDVVSPADEVGVVGATLHVGDSIVANKTVNLAANRVWALVYTVTIL